MNIQIELTSKFVEMSKVDNNGFCFVISAGVPKKILLKTYEIFVRDEIILPIEILNKEEKIKLVDKCRETGLKFTNQTLSDSERILHTLNLINENT